MNRTVATNNFWETLPRPFFALAPMANVTDLVFRKLIAKYGKPDVMWTEFVSADGLVSSGKKNLLYDLKFSNGERPIVAQLFTGHPEVMRKAAETIKDLGFDGLDINMGCPDRGIEKQGGGASLMKNPKLALAILEAARVGVSEKRKKKSSGKNFLERVIPVSIKTRIGYSRFDLGWLQLLLEQKLPALTIHLRTRKEMSDAVAHWELVPEIVEMRDKISPKTLIIGNGDVSSLEQGIEYANKYGCDGIMVGRGVFGKPWFFDTTRVKLGIGYRESSNSRSEIILEPDIRKRLEILVEHAKLFEKTFRDIKNFDVMKKHFKAYVNGWNGAKELRIKLMMTEDSKAVDNLIRKHLKQ
jgi:nifR3 family TIM-barrel protein